MKTTFLEYMIPLLFIIIMILIICLVYKNYQILQQKLFYKFFIEQLYKSTDSGGYDESYSMICNHLKSLTQSMNTTESDRKHYVYYNDICEDSIYSSEEELKQML
jgi:hypothetical protein